MNRATRKFLRRHKKTIERAVTFVPTRQVRLTDDELRNLSALCDGQALLHTICVHGKPQRRGAWHDLSDKLRAAIGEDE